MIDLRYVKKLIDIIDDSSVDSIEITSDKGLKIRISKSPTQRGAVQVAAPMTIPTMLPAAPMGRLSAIRRHPGRRTPTFRLPLPRPNRRSRPLSR
jgi:hypothetical protein